jgi:hypothetical protein
VTPARLLRIFGCGLVALALVAAFSGCGGSGNDSGSSAGTTTLSTSTSSSGTASPLDGWASGLCQAVASWQTTVKTTGAKIDNSQADYDSASQAISSASQALLGSLNGLGAPPAPASAQAQDAINTLSSNLEKESGQIQKTLATRVSSQSQIDQASAQVRVSVAQMNASISKAVSDLKALPDTEGWKKSFQSVPACKAVANA